VLDLVKDPEPDKPTITARPKTMATDPAIARIQVDTDPFVVRFTKKSDPIPALPKPATVRAMSVGGTPNRRILGLLVVLAIAMGALVFSLLSR
jgi:hypothetical protein